MLIKVIFFLPFPGTHGMHKISAEKIGRLLLLLSLLFSLGGFVQLTDLFHSAPLEFGFISNKCRYFYPVVDD